MGIAKPLDVSLAENREARPAPMTHDRLGRPLVGPCLVWTGKVPKDGYARVNVAEVRRALGSMSPQLVHRVSYALAHGVPLSELASVPWLDHLCRVRACSAAAHLEPATPKENVNRGDRNQNYGKTTCKHGHEFTEANTIWRKNGRGCRECKRTHARESWRAKNRPDLVGLPPDAGFRHRLKPGAGIVLVGSRGAD